MDFEKLTFVDQFPEGHKIYRYMDLNWLLETALSHKLSFANITSWPDPYEGAYWKKFVNRETRQEWTDFHKNILGQSWSSLEESDAMWRIYGNHGDVVKVQTSINKLSEIDRVQEGIIGKVRYFADADEFRNTLRELQSRELPDNLKLLLPALMKPVAYKHEEEVRILFHRDFVAAGRSGRAREYFGIHFEHFIEKIVLDPRMGEWKATMLIDYFDHLSPPIPAHKSTLYDSSLKDLPNIELFWGKTYRTDTKQS